MVNEQPDDQEVEGQSNDLNDLPQQLVQVILGRSLRPVRCF